MRTSSFTQRARGRGSWLLEEEEKADLEQYVSCGQRVRVDKTLISRTIRRKILIHSIIVISVIFIQITEFIWPLAVAKVRVGLEPATDGYTASTLPLSHRVACRKSNEFQPLKRMMLNFRDSGDGNWWVQWLEITIRSGWVNNDMLDDYRCIILVLPTNNLIRSDGCTRHIFMAFIFFLKEGRDMT